MRMSIDEEMRLKMQVAATMLAAQGLMQNLECWYHGHNGIYDTDTPNWYNRFNETREETVEYGKRLANCLKHLITRLDEVRETDE